jgi:hypothetical protein
MTSPYQRVCKAMVQMFGPQWTEKYGTKNDEWEAALKGLEYAQISAGITKVRNGTLKYFEIDLPRFIELCKPPRAPMSIGETKRLKWSEDMCEDELQLHFYANQRMMVWCWRHPKWGINGTETEPMPKAMTKQIWESTRRVAHDFFLMREELKAEGAAPTDEELRADLRKALEANWRRIAD